MSEQRCQVVEATPAIDFGVPTGVDILCGLPLEPTGGLCEECGYDRDAPLIGLDGLPEFIKLHGEDHEYQPPLACPVHGEQGGQR